MIEIFNMQKKPNKCQIILENNFIKCDIIDYKADTVYMVDDEHSHIFSYNVINQQVRAVHIGKGGLKGFSMAITYDRLKFYNESKFKKEI